MAWRSRPNRPELDATKVPTIFDIAFAAGFYEGEGTCRMCGGGNRSLAVSVPQKDPEILYKLRDLFGGSVCEPSRNNPCYHWNICGDRARMFIASIYFLLSAKRRAQVDSTDALQFLAGKSPEGLSQEDLALNLAAFYEEKRSNTWRGKNSNLIRRQNYMKRKFEDPEYVARLVERNRERKIRKAEQETQRGDKITGERG